MERQESQKERGEGEMSKVSSTEEGRKVLYLLIKQSTAVLSVQKCTE